MGKHILFAIIASVALAACGSNSKQNPTNSGHKQSENIEAGFFLSGEPAKRTEQITSLVSGELDDFSDPSQRNLLDRVNTLSKAPFKNNAIKNIVVVGAGPAGLMQSLLAFEQGYNVHILEKRQNFERDHIFQIDEKDFNQNIRKYLSQNTYSKLIELGVLQTDSVKGFDSEGRLVVEKPIVTVATRDLENILYGVVKAQERLANGKITITKGATVDPKAIDGEKRLLAADIVKNVDGEELNSRLVVNADAVVVATGAGGGSKPYLQEFGVERIQEFDSKQIRPIGVLVEVKYPAGTLTPDFLDRLNADLAKNFPVENTLNFLRLDKQGKLQINIQLTDTQYERWYGELLNNGGTLDWRNHASKIGDQSKSFFSDILAKSGKSIELDWLKSQTVNTWVADQPISRVNKPAVLVDGSLLVAFSGDSQANNWFLRGDGNPREHRMASIILDEIGKGGKPSAIVQGIESRSLSYIDTNNLQILDSRVYGRSLVGAELPDNVVPFDPRRTPSNIDVQTKPVVKPKVAIPDVPKTRVRFK